MPSAAYELFRQAILEEKQVHCIYHGRRRELCPIILGHKDGEERVLAFQFGGESGSRDAKSGIWCCPRLVEAEDVVLCDGPWDEGAEHRKPQTCVEDVDLDVNIHVRKRR